MLNEGNALVMRRIVDGNPNYYLDETAFLFGMEIGKFVHYGTVRRCLVDILGYWMRVLQKVAIQ